MLMSNSKLDRIIGIDFSLNSPGFCILESDSCKWISLHRTKNIIDKMLKKEGSPFKILNDNSSVDINIIEKKEFKGEYHIIERDKIVNAVYFSEVVMDLLNPYLDGTTIVGMEGLSFGSSGNSLIDISMTTALVRSSIIKKIDPNNFFVLSPTTIKKYALKGNSKKDELYNTLIEKRIEDNRLKPFLNVLKEYRDSWIKGSNKVEGPCSDLVDATWISLFVEENLEKLLLGKKV
jgi:hypothetical protein